MKLLQILIVAALLALNIILIIASLATDSWSKFNNRDLMSLIGCSQCSSLFENWNFECLARSICDENSSLGACKAYKSLYSAGYAYLVLEVTALLMALLLCEKVAIIAVKGNFGNPFMVYALGISMLVSHLLATCLWLGLTKAHWTACEASNSIYTVPSICIEHGPKIAISNIILMAITLVYFFIIFYNRSALRQDRSVILKKFCWLKGQFWGYIVVVLLVISYLLILASITTKNWVNKGAIDGGLLRCENCDLVSNLHWSCLEGAQCNTNDTHNNCGFYRKMTRSARGFLVLEAISIICLVFVSQTVTSILRGRAYGIASLNYLYVIAAAFFNLLAISSWFGISEAKFSDCELCGGDGPGLATASQFFMIPLCLLFCFLYRMREERVEDHNKLDTTISEKVINMSSESFSDSPKKVHPAIDN